MVAWVHWISLLVLTFWLVLVGAKILYAPQEGGGSKRGDLSSIKPKGRDTASD